MWLGSFLGRLGHHGKDSAATTGGLKSAAWAEQGPKKGNPQTEPFSKKTPSYQKSPTSYFVQFVFVLYMCHVFFLSCLFFADAKNKHLSCLFFASAIRQPKCQACVRGCPEVCQLVFGRGRACPVPKCLIFDFCSETLRTPCDPPKPSKN